jgi:diguanylate cyclase (GGDEF)-like protein
MLTGNSMYIGVATVVWVNTGHPTTAWIVPSAILLVSRLWLDIAFRRNRDRFARTTWGRLYTSSSAAIAIVWGLATLLVDGQSNLYVHLLVVVEQVSFIYAAATRLSAYPPAAIAQILITSGLMFGLNLVRHDQTSLLVAVLALINVAPALSFVRQLHRPLISSLCADEEAVEVARSIERANAELAVANAELAALASTDELTAVANRRRLDDVLDTEWRRAERANTSISLYMADIDCFKRYNDALGHQAGDECLRQVAQVLASVKGGPGDVTGRYGGEEFVAILPDTDAFGAAGHAERARLAVEALRLPHPASDAGIVTVSIGVVTLAARPPACVDDLLRCADVALYAAKRTGRNRVCRSGIDSVQIGFGSGVDHPSTGR